jgi:hypothetical protein
VGRRCCESRKAGLKSQGQVSPLLVRRGGRDIKKTSEASLAGADGVVTDERWLILQGSFDCLQHAFEIVIEFFVFKPDDFQVLLLQIPGSLRFIVRNFFPSSCRLFKDSHSTHSAAVID